MSLTAQQRLFVAEYLKDLNATQAAIRAGYSEKTAKAQGARLLTNVAVRTAIDVALSTRIERTQIDADWVLTRLAEEAEADVADLYDDEGRLLPVKDWPTVWRKGLVAGVEVEQLFEGHGKERVAIGTVTKVKLSDRVRRLELIGKHVKVNAFQETIRHTGLDELGDRMARAKAARAKANGGS